MYRPPIITLLLAAVAILIIAGCATLPKDFDRPESYALTDTGVTVFGKAHTKARAAHPGKSGFRLLGNGLAYPAAVLLKGELPTPEKVQKLRGKLNEYMADQSDSEYLQALRNSELANQIRNDKLEFRWGEAEVVFDRPEKLLHDFSRTEYHLAPMLKPYGEGVEKELIIFSPYFVPGGPGTAFLTQLSRRGVRVRILTNSLASNDVGLVHAGYKKYRRKLLRGGVELFELNKKLTRDQREEKRESAARPRPACMPNRLSSTANKSSSAL